MLFDSMLCMLCMYVCMHAGGLRPPDPPPPMSMHVYACLCMSMHVYACLCVSMYAYACLCMSMRVYVCLCMSMHAILECYSGDSSLRGTKNPKL